MAEELDLGAGGRLELGEEGLNFTGGLLTVREFMEEQEHKKDGLQSMLRVVYDCGSMSSFRKLLIMI